MITFRSVKPDDIPKGPGEFQVTDGKVSFTPNKPPAKFKPFPFQIEDLRILGHSLNSDGACANWSEMGCMKTTTGLWLTQETQTPAKRILIITTKTGKVTFFQTAPYLLPDHALINVESTSKLAKIPKQAVVLAHYNLFTNRSKVKAAIQDIHWDFIIIDEAHRLKNRNAQWTKNIKKLKATYKHVMTGTGFINKPDEIWSLLHFMYPKTFTSYWRFRRTVCTEDSGYGAGGKAYSVVTGLKPDQVDAFRELVRKVGVRRTKVELFNELPSLMPPTKVWVDLNPTQRRMYDSMKKELAMLDQNGFPITAPQVLSMLTRLRQVCVATPEVIDEIYDEKLDRIMLRLKLVEPSSKLDALCELLEGTDTPSVVFSQFSGMADLVRDRLERLKISHIHMQAKDKDATRVDKVRQFQEGKTRVFLSTIALGSESITLTAADKVIFLDRSWSPATNNQAVARVHRPGQARPVQELHIEAVKTVDQYVEAKLKKKQGWFDEIFGAE